MPKSQPVFSFTRIRDFAERWTWIDPRTNQKQEGYNPPANAINPERKPFHMLAMTEDGRRIEGDCVTLRVNTSLHCRDVLFVNSGETRRISDLFIIEIDGVRFNVH